MNELENKINETEEKLNKEIVKEILISFFIYFIVFIIIFVFYIFIHELGHMVIFYNYGISSKAHFFTRDAFSNGTLAYVEANETELYELSQGELEDLQFLHGLHETISLHVLFLMVIFFVFFSIKNLKINLPLNKK